MTPTRLAPPALVSSGLALLWLGFAAAPARAEVYAGIEVGSRGIKLTVVDIARPKDADGVAVKLIATKDTDLVAGLAKTGKFDPDALKASAAAVAEFLATAKNDHKVAPANVHVVGSSGLFAPVQDKPELVKESQAALAKAVAEAAGVKMTFVTAAREAELSLKGILPAKVRGSAAVMDIGGGNTKGGYIDAGGKAVTVSVPFGTSSLTQQAKKAGGDFAAEVRKLGASAVAPALKKECAAAPDMAKREHVVLAGGVVWAVSTLSKPGETAAFTPLTLAEVEAVEAQLLAKPGVLPSPDLSKLDAEKRARAEAELKRVAGSFKSADDLLGGVQVLKAVFAEMGLDKGKRVEFARHGYVGWILAYVLEAAGAEK